MHNPKFLVWREVVLDDPAYQGWYEVSNTGLVRSWTYPTRNGPRRREQPVELAQKNVRGYRTVSLANKKNYFVHRLVLEAFVGPCPEGHETAHGDGVRSNNSLHNLSWKTRPDNHADKELHGTQPRGVKHPLASIDDVTAEKILVARLINRENTRDIAERLNTTITVVSGVTTGRTWTHVRPDIPRQSFAGNLKGTPGKVARAKELRSQGTSISVIAETLKVSYPTASKWIRS